jgi:hypothetical protein
MSTEAIQSTPWTFRGRIARFRALGIFCSAIVLVASSHSTAEASGTDFKGSSLSHVPLWKALPTHNFVALKEEEKSGSRWAAFAYRSPGARRADRLCLQIPTTWNVRFGFLGVSPGTRECGSVGQNAQEPVIAASAPIHGLHKTVVVVASAPETSAIEVTVRSGDVVHAATRIIPRQGASKARTSRFAYAVFVLPGDGCLRQISGQKGDGTTVFETPEAPCSATGP